MANRRKVMIVEDDFILYEELTEFFEEKGFLVARLSKDAALDNYTDALRVLKEQQPDIAILDINIKGDKDGIDLGAYIHQHYNIPVIYLSAYNNYENLERIRKTGTDRFVLKASKPLDKSQLWTTFELALPKEAPRYKKKTLGSFFTVKEMIISQHNASKKIAGGSEDDPLEIETFLKWDDILYIGSHNSSSGFQGNNNLLIYSTTPNKAFKLRGTLTEMEKQLPDYFVRFDQATIVNLQKIEGRNKNKTRYVVGNQVFAISDTYKKKALEKIDLLLSTGGIMDMPEN